jgi:hypothetical protein
MMVSFLKTRNAAVPVCLSSFLSESGMVALVQPGAEHKGNGVPAFTLRTGIILLSLIPGSLYIILRVKYILHDENIITGKSKSKNFFIL